MKVYLKIKVSRPVDFFSGDTAFQTAAGEIVPVNSRFQRHPHGINAEVAVRLVRAEEAELVEWAALTPEGELEGTPL